MELLKLFRRTSTPAEALRIETVGQLLEAVHRSASQPELRLEVPMHQAIMEGAFAYAGGWHPLVAAIRNDPVTLAQFYGCFQPKTLAEVYFIDSCDDLRQVGPQQLPWLPRNLPEYRGEKGLGPEHGISLFGPCTPTKIDLEYARLGRVFSSISTHGYRPERYGEITGYFLVGHGTFRFMVRGGKHRAAALAALGRGFLPVILKPGWEPAIFLERFADWPLVQSGTIGIESARRVFERFLAWDGTQQRSRFASPASGLERAD